tara:strand:- start:456 stop:803 length:348 start_codon:yes stop_codon:yes gene_type:complete
MNKKECTKCFKMKEITEFWKNRKNKDGREYLCKKCSYIKNKKYSPQVSWRKQIRGFLYKSTEDPQYIKDKAELLNKHGNGWWCEVKKYSAARYPSGKSKPIRARKRFAGEFIKEE